MAEHDLAKMPMYLFPKSLHGEKTLMLTVLWHDDRGLSVAPAVDATYNPPTEQHFYRIYHQGSSLALGMRFNDEKRAIEIAKTLLDQMPEVDWKQPPEYFADHPEIAIKAKVVIGPSECFFTR